MKGFSPTGLMTLLITLMALPTIGNARPGSRGGGGEGMDLNRLERMADRLELDEESLNAMKQMLYAAQEKGIELKAKAEAARLAVKRSMDVDVPDRDQVMKNLERLSVAQLELRKLRTSTMLDIQAKMTPEQRKKLRTHLRKKGHKRKGRREGHGERRGRHNGHGPLGD